MYAGLHIRLKMEQYDTALLGFLRIIAIFLDTVILFSCMQVENQEMCCC